MASLLDVQNAIVAAVAPTCPSGHQVRYFAGPAFAKKINDDLKNGNGLVSVTSFNTEQRVKTFLNDDEIMVSDTGLAGGAVMVQEVSRQKKWFQINVYAPDPTYRDVVGEALKVLLDQTLFLNFSDTTSGHIQYVQEYDDDSGQEAGVYRRLILYTVEYATTVTTTTTDACHQRVSNKAGQEAISNESPATPYSVLVDKIT
jgi:hypothetical protein